MKKKNHATRSPTINCAARLIVEKDRRFEVSESGGCWRHEAQRTRSSCSATHSRQENLRHSGQRAAASRKLWLKQRCVATPGFEALTAVPPEPASAGQPRSS